MGSFNFGIRKNNKANNRNNNRNTDRNSDRSNNKDNSRNNRNNNRFARRQAEKEETVKKVPLGKRMDDKLVLYFGITVLAFLILSARLYIIGHNDGDRYKKIVLSQQTYNSTSLPYKRGSISDRNGIILAHSVQVFNLIIDSNEMNKDPEKAEETLRYVKQYFPDVDIDETRRFMLENQESPYHIVLKELHYDEVRAYEEFEKADESPVLDAGIWFEPGFKREYPNGRLAADVIGFMSGDGTGNYGLEEYYESTLCGTDGRTYGYRTNDYGMEYTVIPAVNGLNLVTTIDSFIQDICEEKILEFNEEHRGEYRENEDGSDNTAVIVMDIDSGEVLAMASYPFFDLKDPYDISAYYTEEELAALEAEGKMVEAQSKLWKNFCISQSYEPGSVNKTFTVSAALDSGSIHDGDEYFCGGYTTLGQGQNSVTIRCHNRYGEGMLDVKGAVENSCNVSLVYIGQKTGVNKMVKYLGDFNFGLKTNIDLAGEMRTDSLVFNEKTMGATELATSSFGQGYNVTMIQTITAFCSVINGGYYYKPHVVSKIVDDNGSTIESFNPVLLRQPISEKTSELLRDYCIGVVEEGTGKYARPAGYRIGGKTGTAEHSGEGKVDYVVSFCGFAPADDPQIAIYVVIDRPNVASQDSATRYACIICNKILTDVLPYMGIQKTEELTEKERKELQEHEAQLIYNAQHANDDPSVSENEAGANGEGQGQGEEREVIDITTPGVENRRNIVIDKSTGYAIDPLNGEYLDPETGVPINGGGGIFQNESGETINLGTSTNTGNEQENGDYE